MTSILEAALVVAFCRVGWLVPQLLPDFSGCFAFTFSGFLWQDVSFKRGQKKNVKEGGIRLKEDSLSGIVCLTQLKTKLKALNANLDARFFGFQRAGKRKILNTI